MRRRNFLFVLGLITCIAPGFAAFKGAKYRVRRPAQASRAKEQGAPESNVLEFQVTADEPFPVRALDPVLHVGDYEARAYRYDNMENTSITFTCAEADKLKDGAPVYLQYENDRRTRTALPDFHLSMIP